ncbi:MAG TPA: superoxide dismutase family protein [Thermohalobaculum sp.]|nr:superoxide dismutase family protein [Thermohalobaculum sp.]
MRMSRMLAIAAITATFPIIASAADTATATLMGPKISIGTVTLTQGPNGVLVSADVTGLTPGAHGFHIHQTGSCTPDFKAAGGHYNPGGGGHGILDAGGHHAGDLPNIHAGADGSARADYFTADVTLADGAANSVFDADGSTIVIHENPDSYGADAGAGGRVACGVIIRN